MIVELIERAALVLSRGRVKRIDGCEPELGHTGSQGNATDPYLTRYVLYEGKRLRVYIHVFERSDWSIELHDHPWSFAALLLWPGYVEESADPKCPCPRVKPGSHLADVVEIADGACTVHTLMRVKVPGMILFRRAAWRHRVQLFRREKERGWWVVPPEGDDRLGREFTQPYDELRHASLVIVGPKERSWGFWPGNVFVHWREFLRGKGC